MKKLKLPLWLWIFSNTRGKDRALKRIAKHLAKGERVIILEKGKPIMIHPDGTIERDLKYSIEI